MAGGVVMIHDQRWWRFVMVGGLCFTVNLLVLYLATDVWGWHYLLSMLLSIAIANTLGWFLNRVWTFVSTSTEWFAEYLRYLSVNLSSFVLSLLSMAALVSGLGIHYLAASAINAVALTMFNYLAHRGWSFAERR